LSWVGYYLCFAALLSFIALGLSQETGPKAEA